LEDRIVLAKRDRNRMNRCLNDLLKMKSASAIIRSTIEQFNRHIAEIESSIREKRDRIAKLKASLDELNGKSGKGTIVERPHADVGTTRSVPNKNVCRVVQKLAGQTHRCPPVRCRA
jgi:predicted RNase H-like nuclease (RuvC/YqgF family)